MAYVIPRGAKRVLIALLLAVVGYHIFATAACVVAIAFPNIFKRYTRYSAGLVKQMPHEGVVFASRRGCSLAGWFFRRQDSAAVVLLCHGRSSNKTHELPYVRAFADYCNVFVFDFAGHGDNPYAATSIGYNEAADVLGALDWLGGMGITQAVVLGHSMGGSAALRAVSEYTGPVQIKAVITEGAFADLGELLRSRTGDMLLPPTVWWPAFRIAERIAGYRISDNVPERFIRSVTCPVLVMQADKDWLAPSDSARRLAGNAGGPVEVVAFKGRHDQPCDEVSSNALRFVTTHMPPASGGTQPLGTDGMKSRTSKTLL
ncbi:MAG: alpha/beta fold hydrolase [bacterium]